MTSLNAEQAKWMEKALAESLVDHELVVRVLVAAAQTDVPLEQLLETEFSKDSAGFERLRSLFQQNTPETNRSPNSVSPSTLPDQTLAAGRKRKQAESTPVSTRKFESTAKAAGSNPAVRDAWRLRQPKLGLETSSLLESLKTGSARYEIKNEIGRGGCGIVATAYDHQIEREIVVKQIVDGQAHDETIRRFVNEARITGQLQHPGIVPVYEVGVDSQNLPYYAMKQVHGQTLAEKLEQMKRCEHAIDRKLQKYELLNRFLDICQTLAYAHQQGVIHRDLKPANVMIGEFGETILLDWGLARTVELAEDEAANHQTVPAGRYITPETLQSPTESDLFRARDSHRERGTSASARVKLGVNRTSMGTVLGTAAYMAPEQALGLTDRLNEQSDVFSLGVMLYEILSGESPFRAESVQETIARVARCDFRPLEALRTGAPRPLLAICHHALQREQADRYPSAREFAEDMQNFLAGGGVSVYRENLWERFDRLAERNRSMFRTVFLSTIAIALVACVAVGQVTRANYLERTARDAETIARQAAESALANEQLARERTRRQLLASRKAADTWLLDLSSDLQFYPGLAPLRNALIDQALNHYQKLLGDTNGLEDEPTLQAEYHLRLGDLRCLKHEFAIALENFRQAEELIQGEADDVHGRVLLANSLLGQELAQAGNAKAVASPEDRLDEARDLVKEILRDVPDHCDARNALVRIQLIAARRLDRQEQVAQAIDLLQGSMADIEILCQQEPSPRTLKLKATVLEDQARYLFRAEEYSRASEVAQRLVHLYDDFIRAAPSVRPDWLEAKALAQSLFGSCVLALHDPLAAAEAFHVAHTDLDIAWEALYGEAFYRENRAVLLANQGSAELELGNASMAIDQFSEAINELRWLVENDALTDDRVLRMASCYLVLAEAYVSLGDVRAQQLLDLNETLLCHLSELPHHTALITKYLLQQAVLRGECALLVGDQAALEQSQSRIGEIGQTRRFTTEQEVIVEVYLNKWTLNSEAKKQREGGRTTLAPPELDQNLRDKLAAASLRSIDLLAQLKSSASPTIRRMTLELISDFPLVELRRPAEAVMLAKAWAADMPRSSVAWHWLAWSCYQTGDLAEAEAALQQSRRLQSRPAVPENELLEALLVGSRNSQEGARLFQRVVAGNSAAQLGSSHARCLLTTCEGALK